MEPAPPGPQRLGRLMAVALWATVLVVTGVSAAERLGLIDLASDTGVRCSTQIRFCEPVEPEAEEPADSADSAEGAEGDRVAECAKAAGEATGPAVERLLENCVKNPQADGLLRALERHNRNAARKASKAEHGKGKPQKGKGEKDPGGASGEGKGHSGGDDGSQDGEGKRSGGSGGGSDDSGADPEQGKGKGKGGGHKDTDAD